MSPVPRLPAYGLAAAFADLELEAEGLYLEQRALEAAEVSNTEYAEVTLAGRLLASVGTDVGLRLVGGLVVHGRVLRAAEHWLLVEGTGTWLVPSSAIASVRGLSNRAVSEPARTVLARLSFRSALRRLAHLGSTCVLRLADGGTVEGRIGRVGADFVEVAAATAVETIPLPVVAAVQETA